MKSIIPLIFLAVGLSAQQDPDNYNFGDAPTPPDVTLQAPDVTVTETSIVTITRPAPTPTAKTSVSIVTATTTAVVYVTQVVPLPITTTSLSTLYVTGPPATTPPPVTSYKTKTKTHRSTSYVTVTGKPRATSPGFVNTVLSTTYITIHPGKPISVTIPHYSSAKPAATTAPVANEGIVQCGTTNNSPNYLDCVVAIETVVPGTVGGICLYNQNKPGTLVTIAKYRSCAIQSWNYDADARCFTKDDLDSAKNKLKSCRTITGTKIVNEATWIYGRLGMRVVLNPDYKG